MKKTNFWAILATSILSFGATFTTASAEEIRLKGLSVSSTVVEIEAVFGPCGDKPDENGWHYCGGSDVNAYKETSDGAIDQIYFHCEIISACDYPVAVLAKMLKSERSMIIAMETENWDLAKHVSLYGSSGDVLTLQSFKDDGRDAFISLTANSPISLD